MAKRSYIVTFKDGHTERVGADSEAQVRRVYADRLRGVKLAEDHTKNKSGIGRSGTSRTVHTDRSIW